MVQLSPVLSARAPSMHRISQPLPALSEHTTFSVSSQLLSRV